VFAQVEREFHAPSVAVGVDEAFELFSHQALEVGEELDREDKGRVSLEFGVRRCEHIVGAAIALGDRDHAVFLAERAGLGAAYFLEASAAELDGVVVGGSGSGLRHGHDDLR
jgi:hypothetical protein